MAQGRSTKIITAASLTVEQQGESAALTAWLAEQAVSTTWKREFKLPWRTTDLLK